MSDPAALKSQINTAFADVEFPGDRWLRDSDEGDEPFLLEQEFAGKSNWCVLDPEFLNQAPDGYATALCFFSQMAFRFYLPAYLLADIDGRLDRPDPVFHLTHGLTDEGKTERVNPQRYGEQTWFELTSHKFGVFNERQAAAIVAYLRHKSESDHFSRNEIDQALTNFWLQRAGESGSY